MTQYLLSIDQGTTSSRAIIFSVAGDRVAIGQHDYAQHYPHDSW